MTVEPEAVAGRFQAQPLSFQAKPHGFNVAGKIQAMQRVECAQKLLALGLAFGFVLQARGLLFRSFFRSRCGRSTGWACRRWNWPESTGCAERND